MRKNWVTGITAIRGLATLAFLLLSSGPAVAKTVSTGDKVVAVVAAESSARLRVCYYQDQAYSIGAVLNVEGVLLECVAEKSFETNGALKWQQIKIKDEPKS
ncbi:TPA: DUF1496 domain-containing protein [Vibrio vulnificus]|nr:DUF1496 domain-containing protein [Vibrio vulnificus]HAT7739554.1 DUF1496 domain-containing protein [Vibrio vulnificus]